MFVDEVHVHVEAGHGGPGITAWRREKYVPFGGPAGGDGGRGGDVILQADENLHTLMDLRYRRRIKAEKGRSGGPNRRTGRDGKPSVIRVPVGTAVYDGATEALIADLVEDGQRVVIAEGGIGGRGNARFVTSTNRAPERCEPGLPGSCRDLRLELKLLADVGIIGYPSVGKSTLIAAISNARPKIASYPFTTLVPNLGMVGFHDDSFVVADIPGLIEGAHEGQGLGHQFLRHVERCQLLVHVLEVPPPFDYGDGIDWTERDPLEDFARINRELALFDRELADREQIVVLNKIDLEHVQARRSELAEWCGENDLPFVAISAATREGLGELIQTVGSRVVERRRADRVAQGDEPADRRVRELLGLSSGTDGVEPADSERLEDERQAVERGEGASGLGREADPDT